jgi:peptide/nickel transport system substrate-binding protein
MKRRDFLKGGTALAAGTVIAGAPAVAQSRKDVLITVSEGGPNSFDVHAPGSNRGGYEVSWNGYDRLIRWAMKPDGQGQQRWDSTKFAPEVAEDWDLRDMSVTFKLRRDVKFHDGTPLTAKDVKWSLDRAVSIPGFPKSQMSIGSLTDPKQFVVVDDHTFRVDFLHKDKLTMPTLGVPVAPIMNSGLVQKHATASDPWGLEWLKGNQAGSGAYKIVSRLGDQEVAFIRNEQWKCGPVPKTERVIWRIVPSAASRRALIERGDVDVSVDLPPKDVSEMSGNGQLTVVGTPMDNSVQYLGMQVTMPPFDNVKVRKAVAYAIPYQKILDVALYGRARLLSGGPAQVTTTEWPQPHPYTTDLAKAKQLLTEAGFPNGFETTLSFDLGVAVTNEPMCILIQESLGQIGIKVNLDKVAGSNWRAAFQSKKLPFITNLFGAWLNYPDYFFHWAYHGQNALFNSSSYVSPVMDKYIDAARFEDDPEKYKADVESFIKLAWEDVPTVPLYQPLHNVALRKGITGYQYWFHRQLDYRSLAKA